MTSLDIDREMRQRTDPAIAGEIRANSRRWRAPARVRG